MNNTKLLSQLLLYTAITFMTACCTAMTGTKGQNDVQTTTICYPHKHTSSITTRL